MTVINHLAAGPYSSLGLTSEGDVFGAGHVTYGGGPTLNGLSGAVQVAAGAYHSVVLLSDGTVAAAGWDNVGQVSGVASWTGVVKLATKRDHTLGIKSDGTVVAAGGSNVSGELNTGSWSNVVDVACGDNNNDGTDHSLGLLSDGTVVACGADGDGQVSGVAPWTNVVQVSAGHRFSVGLRSDGTVVHCGQDPSSMAATIAGWSDIVQVSAGGSTCLGLTASGEVLVAGSTAGFSGGDVGGQTSVIEVSKSKFGTLLLYADGSVFGTGLDSYGVWSAVQSWTLVAPPQTSADLPALRHTQQCGSAGWGLAMNLGAMAHGARLRPRDPDAFWRGAATGRLQRVTLRDSAGLILPILSADIFLSGTRGVSITLVVPPNTLSDIKAGADPWRLVDATSGEVYRMPTIGYQYQQSGMRRSLVVHSNSLISVRVPKNRTVNAPTRTWPNGQDMVAQIPGAWDLIPGDMVEAGDYTTVANHTQLHISNSNPRTWVYG